MGSLDEDGRVAKLKWRVKLVAERHPGVVTETELACIERDEAWFKSGSHVKLGWRC